MSAGDSLRHHEDKQERATACAEPAGGFREIRAGDGDWVACCESRKDEMYKRKEEEVAISFSKQHGFLEQIIAIDLALQGDV